MTISPIDHSKNAAITVGKDEPVGELNVRTGTIFINDNLKVMRGIESGTIDLIATDPPFNKKRMFEAPIGSDAEGSSFSDKWSYDEVKESWVNNMEKYHPQVWNLVKTILATGDKSLAAFIIYMHTRALEMHRILKPTGSLYWHCDQEAGHYLKIMLDCIFGKENFKNDVIWSYDFGGRSKTQFPKKHDNILFYTKSKNWKFNTDDMERLPYKATIHKYHGDDESKKKGKLPTDVWDIAIINTMSNERTGYATQKPLKLYERIIKASTDRGDVVLDPFCGCATTCVAAERLQRKWIGIDVSERAYKLVVQRLAEKTDVALDTYYEVIKREDLPVRKTDIVTTPKKDLRKVLYVLQDGKCNHCGTSCTPEQMSSFFDLDHIVPRSKGGHDGDSNMQLLCRSCNSSKGNKDDATAKARLEKLEKELGLR